MIKKTFIAFFILFLINVLVRDFYKPHIVLPQTQGQWNLYNAQSYLYAADADTIENIIVGSSLACRLHIDSLAAYKFKNLAFGGGSPSEGLNIIIRKGHFPKRVFIETNCLLRDTEYLMLNTLYNPILYPLRKNITTLRDGKQPIPLISALAEAHIIRKIIPNRFEQFDRFYTGGDKPARIELTTGEDNNTKNPTEEQIQIFNRIKGYIETLKENGTNIIFFEMPTETLDCRSETAPLYRMMTEEIFPPAQYPYIPTVDCGSYKTTDGIHLDSEEAARYTHYFKVQADSLIGIGQ